MTFPNVPTDSLYKFMAIAGLAMLISSAYIASTTMTAMQDNIAKESVGMEERGSAWIDRQMANLIAEYPDKDERLKRLEELKPMYKYKQQLDLDQYTKRVDEIRIEAATVMLMLRVLEIIGFALTPLGFALWWWKIQRHQDAILLAERQKKTTSENGQPTSDGESNGRSAPTPEATLRKRGK